jgi:phage terminase small subunit
MAKRGRKPKPTLLHELQGTLNTTRHAGRAHELQIAGNLDPEPPDFLTDGQKDSWRYVMQHAPPGLLRAVDRTALVIWVEADDRLRRAIIGQAAHDRRHPSMPLLTPRRVRDGVELVEAPYSRVITRAGETLLRAMADLGFSPASRPRIPNAETPATPLDSDNPWARLKVLQGGKSSGTT